MQTPKSTCTRSKWKPNKIKQNKKENTNPICGEREKPVQRVGGDYYEIHISHIVQSSTYSFKQKFNSILRIKSSTEWLEYMKLHAISIHIAENQINGVEHWKMSREKKKPHFHIKTQDKFEFLLISSF